MLAEPLDFNLLNYQFLISKLSVTLNVFGRDFIKAEMLPKTVFINPVLKC